MVHDNLSLLIYFRTEGFGKAIEINIATRGEERLQDGLRTVLQAQGPDAAASMFQAGDLLRINRELILAHEILMPRVPLRFAPVGEDSHGGGICEHGQGVINRFIVPTVNADG